MIRLSVWERRTQAEEMAGAETLKMSVLDSLKNQEVQGQQRLVWAKER